MPRYHFASVDGHREADPEGIELADLAAARQMAIEFAGDVLSRDPEQVWQTGRWRVEVSNDDGTLLFTLMTLAMDGPVANELAAG